MDITDEMTDKTATPRKTPIEVHSDRIMIVFSTHATPEEDVQSAVEVIGNFALDDVGISAEAIVFGIPSASRSGHSLGAELGATLDSCVGAVVFVDDLRPNVAYELGYMHGKGRSVLLITRGEPEAVWREISDLAGAPLADLRRRSMADHIREYLTCIYKEDLRLVDRIESFPLPSGNRNLIHTVSEQNFLASPSEAPVGQILKLRRYDPPIVIPVRRNISPSSRAEIILRAPHGPEHFSVYFLVWYSNQRRDPARLNLGITSHRRDAWITHSERQLPGPMLGQEWSSIAVEFKDLFRRGSVLGATPPDYLEHISFRIGHRYQPSSDLNVVEVAYVGIAGFND